MYELIDKGNDRWALMIGHKVRYSGSFRHVVAICLRELRFDSRQLDMAVQEMCKPENKGHDVAHFGVYRTFLFSYNSKEQQRVG